MVEMLVIACLGAHLSQISYKFKYPSEISADSSEGEGKSILWGCLKTEAIIDKNIFRCVPAHRELYTDM